MFLGCNIWNNGNKELDEAWKNKLLSLDLKIEEKIFLDSLAFINLNGNGYGIYNKDGTFDASSCFNTNRENDNDCYKASTTILFCC